ncbi:MAG: PQQ-binding-like beta-propeller repeat protein [Planctomycetes bacterium]|nr:PQQ-binding-like beta-propeller repeat protein [Planctomycetota bacterium]
MNRSLVFLLLFCLVSFPLAAEENWPQFRGQGSLGVSSNKNLPAVWSETKNVAWKRDLPGRGWSSPVVWGDRIFLTTVTREGQPEDAKRGLYFGGNRAKPPTVVHRRKVVCLSTSTGKVLWERVAHEAIPKYGHHIKSSYASETPVTDGERLYVYFGNVGVFCYTTGGKPLWSKRLKPHKMRYDWGTASSPVLHKGRLYLVNDNDEESYLLALDAKTGKEIWRTGRKEKSNWATPYVWPNTLRTEIIVPGSGKIRSYDLDGKLLYELGGGSSITIATPYSKFGLLYVSSGYILDRKKPLFAIRPGASGDISLKSDETSNKHIAWCQKRAGPYNPTTLVYGELLYVLLDRGMIACYEAKTGREVYGRQRIDGGRAFTASPWAYDGKIFCLNEYGQTFVIQAGRKFKLLSTNALAKDDLCMSTPAIAGDKLIIRTAGRVYCIKTSL